MQSRRVVRKRLLERIRRAQEKRIVLLFADAGFGKSVALEQFLASERRPCAFYRVPPDTTSLLGFLRGLTAALEPFTPGAHLSLTMAHTRAMQSRTPFVELASWFGEHLRDGDLCIAIDDLHNATSDSTGDFLSHATAETPQSLRWIIAARPTPTFSAAPWLAGGELDWPIDESELRFTAEEARELAERCGRYLSSATTTEILKLTAGHAASVALAISLPDAVRATEGVGTNPYAALANATFDSADTATRDFLLRTCVYDTLRFEVLDRSDKEILASLIERSGLYINAVDADSYRYDASFRDFLRAKLRQHSVELESQVLVSAAGASERASRWADAIKLHLQAKASAALTRVLVDRGFALIEVGAVEAVEAGIEALPESTRDRDPKLLALRAIIDSQHARFDTSEAWFRLAIHELADDDLRLRILYRYALDLLRRSRLDCIELLEPSIELASKINHELYPMLCATLATAYTIADRLEESRALIAKAVPLLERLVSAELRARGYHQAAYVALRCGSISEAERFALKARDIAVGANLYDLAARASSILYEIAYVWNASPSQALEYVENVASFALKSGDAAVREWALVAAYYVAAERGDPAMMAAIERSLDVADVLQMTNDKTTTLLPGQALRATWSADFAHAYQLLARSGDEQLTPDRRALRWAEIALYAAAAGMLDQAREALSEARRRLPDTGEGKLAIQALSFALLAATLLRDSEARRDLRRDNRLARLSGRLAALFEAVEAIHNYNERSADHHALLAALEALHDAGLGGVAAMLEALPVIPRLEEPTARL